MRRLRRRAPRMAQPVRSRARTPAPATQTANSECAHHCRLPPSLDAPSGRGRAGLATGRGQRGSRTGSVDKRQKGRKPGLWPAPPAHTHLPNHTMREVTWGQGSRDTHFPASRAQGSEPLTSEGPRDVPFCRRQPRRELKGVSHLGNQEPSPLHSLP